LDFGTLWELKFQCRNLASSRLSDQEHPVSIELRNLQSDDLDRIAAVDGGAAWKSDRALWSGYLADQQNGRRTVLLAFSDQRLLGYGTLVWEPNYQPFRSDGTPEINNLVVASQARRQGVASAMIRAFERSAKEAGRKTVGLAVGLYADYGAAQRLYVSLGYRPDGNGITYAGKFVPPGDRVKLDDDLVLWLVKAI
jgi:GNAT superfamily N-acetyltransferase